MSDSRILENLHFQIDKEKVFAQINCYPDSPVYEEMEEMYEEILPDICRMCRPRGILGRGIIPARCRTDGVGEDADAVISILTVGQEISDFSTRSFEEGEYVKGMLADAMADAALFSLEKDSQEELRRDCARWGVGIRRRLEAPHDLTMEIQREAMIQTRADQLLGLEITEGYMYRPLKTSCNVYMTTSDTAVFQAQHNCRKCPNLTCGLRHVEPVQVTVLEGGSGSWRPGTDPEQSDALRTVRFETEGGIMDGLREGGVKITAACGGTGRCGKCRIRVLEGSLEITAEDRKCFRPEELDAGWRLACRAVPDEDVILWTPGRGEDDIQAVADYMAQDAPGKTESGDQEGDDALKYSLAVDIGTTTIAVQMVWERNRDTSTALNPQRQYGADVISRIQASNEGKGQVLMEEIRSALYREIRRLQERNGVDWRGLSRIAVAGNTTMIHLLMGYPCDGLGSVPFTPYQIGDLDFPLKQWFEEADPKTRVQIFPGISVFVGADIVSGLCALDFLEKEETALLIDLGTNGEMALGNGKKLLVTSTAAGPAFEGGNITRGTGSIPGAVCKACWNGQELEVETIRQQPAVGICGTGVVEITAELVKAEVIDETGRMEDPWFEDGYQVARDAAGKGICLYQKDVREIQLAKAAVRAGIETLLEKYGIAASQVDRIYVAGGFGYQLDYQKAAAIGMLPEEFAGKVQAVGNSSLAGTVMLLQDPETMEKARLTAALASEISLADDPVFQQAYMDGMFFESDSDKE